MKKLLRTLILLSVLIIPMFVNAEYGIEKYYINATVESNGDLLVEEYFIMNGEFNGYNRIIDFSSSINYTFNPELSSLGSSKLYDGTGITIKEVKGLDIDYSFDFSNTDGDNFNKVTSASKGDYKKYTEEKSYNGTSLMIYNPNKKKKAFYIKYTLKNMAVRHNDVGELWWQVFSDELRESVGEMNIKVNFPNNKNEFKVWAHGPLNGEVQKNGNNQLEATIKDVRAYQKISVRATFDLDIIKNSIKTSGIDGLQKILNYEEDSAAQANYEREQKSSIAIKNIKIIITELELNPSREKYNEGIDELSYVMNQTTKKELKEQLDSFLPAINLKEEEEALTALKIAEENPKYDNYLEARTKIIILENEELKKEYEQRLKEVYERVTKEEKNKVKEYEKSSIEFIVIIIVLIIIIFITNEKEPTSEFEQEYLREFPKDELVSNISYLLYDKLTPNGISALILDMVYKKKIEVEEIDNGKDYKLIFKEQYNLSDVETRLTKLLFNDKNEITLKGFKKNAKSSYTSFNTRWSNLETACEREMNKKKYFKDHKVEKTEVNQAFGIAFTVIIIFLSIIPYLAIIAIPLALIGWIVYKMIKTDSKRPIKMIINILIVIGYIITIVLLVNVISSINIVDFNPLYSLIPFVLLIIAKILNGKKVKFTQYGINEFKMWEARRKFLKDFSSMEYKEIPEIAIWEIYLVYATLFGCAKKIAEQMKIRIPESQMIGDAEFTYHMSYHIQHSINDSIRQARSAATREAAAAAAASSSSGGGSWSSGGGGGGGFSSSGGGGGGGGGGRF